MEMRTPLGIKPSDQFRFIEQDEGIPFRRIGPRVTDHAGVIPPPKGREHVDLDFIIQEIKDERADELVRRFNEESEPI
jgi:hypothetical protein